MRIKSFFANSVREAIDNARKELGPDAMIIASHKAEPGQGNPGAYEVVCGIAGAAEPESRQAPPPAPARPRSNLDAQALLKQAGFEEKLMRDILAGVGRRVKKRLSSGEALAAELQERLSVRPELGRTQCSRKVVALVGPPGAGKTTTLSKLAVTYGLTARKPMHLISMDGYRIAGAEALRAYAGAMAVGFDALETANALAQTLEQQTGKGLILIDTPGLGPADLPGAAPLASFLSRHPEADVQLVLPATLAPQEMTAAFARFRPYLPSRLIFTCADVACSLGPAIGQALLHELPISFLGTGQMVPEDLERATIESLLDRFLPATKAASATSAA